MKRFYYAVGFVGGVMAAWAFVALLVQAYATAFFEPITWRASFGMALLVSVWLIHHRGGPLNSIPPLKPSADTIMVNGLGRTTPVNSLRTWH